MTNPVPLAHNTESDSPQDSYSPLEHLARALFLSRETLIGMLTLYCDASGKPNDTPSMVVAGYFASVNQWDNFNTDWKLVLSKYGVPYFHMKEFAHSVKAFEDWKGKEGTRENFLKDLVSVIRARVLFGVACAVKFEAFQNVDKEYTLSEIFGNEYALCARDCVAQASKIAADRGLEGMPVEFVFEAGDDGMGDLIRVLKRDKNVLPIFKPGKSKDGQSGLTPLQAADFAAWELLKASRTEIMSPLMPLVKYRESLKALATIKGWWGQYTEDDLRQMCIKGGISRRDRIYDSTVAIVSRKPFPAHEIPDGGQEFSITVKPPK